MMAEKTRLFQVHRVVELVMSSPSPSTSKRIGRGVRNFDSGVGDREKENAVLSGTYAEFTQNPAIKKSRFELMTTSFWLNLALWTQCGALVSRRMIPRPTTYASEENVFFGEALSAVRKATGDSETGSAHPASPSRFCTCTGNARTKKSRPLRGGAVTSSQRSQRFPFGVSGLFLGRVGQLKAVKVWR